MITGLINCGLGLGSATGPIISGAIVDILNFAWTTTMVAVLSVFMVSQPVSLYIHNFKHMFNFFDFSHCFLYEFYDYRTV